MDSHLRSECRSLLEQLKKSQQFLNKHIAAEESAVAARHNDSEDPIEVFHFSRVQGKKGLTSNFGKDLTGQVNVSIDANTDLKPTYARNKLSSLAVGAGKTDVDQNEKECIDGQDLRISHNGKENYYEIVQSASERRSKNYGESLEFDRNQDRTSIDDCTITSSSWQPATPNTQRRRQMIDRHTVVPTKLDPEDLRDLDNERRLNFSYSHINADDKIVNLDSGPNEYQETSQIVSKSLSSREKVTSVSRLGQEDHRTFEKQLTDDGNSRRLNNFMKEASIKPKSILNSSAYYSLNSNKKNTSKVHFNASRSMDELCPSPDHRLLGYDWIAALIDNDPCLIDQSESFFDELKDFRKAYKDECSNRFYMEGPHTLVDSEPEPIVEALTEPKIRPYVVNERLFTEPFRPDLIDYDDGVRSKKGGKEPTKDNPRFVRVSIPRSTLQTPYRVKPHRRSSFDAADSCALMDHCLLGWENTRPAMLPSAQTLDLNTEANTRVDSETTTLAEAEKQATLYNRTQWPFAKPTARQQTLPTWQKQYMNATLNLSMPDSALNSTASLSGSKPTNLKRATDRLLRETYSSMYEMERVKQERELDRKNSEEERNRKKLIPLCF